MHTPYTHLHICVRLQAAMALNVYRARARERANHALDIQARALTPCPKSFATRADMLRGCGCYVANPCVRVGVYICCLESIHQHVCRADAVLHSRHKRIGVRTASTHINRPSTLLRNATESASCRNDEIVSASSARARVHVCILCCPRCVDVVVAFCVCREFEFRASRAHV